MKALTALAVILLANPAAALPQAQNQNLRNVHRQQNEHIVKHTQVATFGINQRPLATRMQMTHADCKVDYCFKTRTKGHQFTWVRTNQIKDF